MARSTVRGQASFTDVHHLPETILQHETYQTRSILQMKSEKTSLQVELPTMKYSANFQVDELYLQEIKPNVTTISTFF